MKKIKEDNLKELQHEKEVLLSKFEDKKTKQKALRELNEIRAKEGNGEGKYGKNNGRP